MGIHKTWTKEQDDYLRNNYSNKKASLLAEELNKTKISIKNRLKKLGLLLSVEEKKERYALRVQKFNIDYEFFSNPKNENLFTSAYLLGYLWADGYINKKLKRQDNKVVLYIVTEDANDVKNLFLQSGEWRFRNEIPKIGKPLTAISAYSKDLHCFLEQMDFKIKSQTSPYKILQGKQTEYIRGFWRGCLDGDGCYHFNPDPRIRKKCISLFGTKNQDWTSYTNFLKSLEIDFQVREKGSCSLVEISRAKSIVKLIDFIYPNEKYDLIGLKRKFCKAKKIKKYIENLMIKNKHYYK